MKILATMVLIIAYMISLVNASENVHNVEEINTEVQGVEDAIIADYEAKAAIQFEAIQAYQKLSETFIVDRGGYVTYPKDYAGAWIEGPILYVALTSVEDVKSYDQIFSEFDSVEYTKAEHSLNDLEAIQHEIFQILNKNHDTYMIAYYVDVQTNQMVFEVEKNPADFKKSLESLLKLQTFSTRSDAPEIDIHKFVIKVGEPINLE